MKVIALLCVVAGLGVLPAAAQPRDPVADAYNQFLELHGIPLHPELIEKAKKTSAVHHQPQAVAGGEE